MSSGFRPNEQMILPGLGIPVDPLTGELLSPVADHADLGAQRSRESVPPAPPRTRRHHSGLDGPATAAWRMAFTKLEEAQMWATAAVLDHYGD